MERIRTLLLSGAGNHDWKHFTPVIRAQLEASEGFRRVTLRAWEFVATGEVTL